MNKKFLLLGWIILAFTTILSFSPFRIPDYNKDFSTPNYIYVTHRECTCCANFDIEKGEILIPESFKNQIGNNYYEIMVSGQSPLNILRDELSTYYLISENNFILKGKVTGVDSSECSKRPIFTVESWTTDRYHLRYLTWGGFGLILIKILPVFFIVLSIFTAFYFLKSRGKSI